MGAICVDQTLKISRSGLVLTGFNAQRPQASYGFEVFFFAFLSEKGQLFIILFIFNHFKVCAH